MHFNFHKNHRLFVGTVFVLYLLLSILIAVQPAVSIQENNASLPGAGMMEADVEKGLQVFIAEGCVACHTQQVRNIDMDKMWGGRPGIPADYAWRTRMDVWRQTPSVLGTERTGPDLTEVGERQPSGDWHYLHLYNPRAVVKESVMPAYPWLFEEKKELAAGEKNLTVPDEFREGLSATIVPTRQAKYLVAYLLSLKQTDLPVSETPAFIEYSQPKMEETLGSNAKPTLNGSMLYTQHCQACHQANGEGLKGAFPPLKSSNVVAEGEGETLVRIILQGYDARPEYAVMPAFAAKLTDEEVAAIATHERSEWGNNGSEVTADFVRQIREKIESETQ